MSMEGIGGFALSALSVEARLVYRVIANLIKSTDPISFERALCLYVVLKRVRIDFATVTITIMKKVDNTNVGTWHDSIIRGAVDDLFYLTSVHETIVILLYLSFIWFISTMGWQLYDI